MSLTTNKNFLSPIGFNLTIDRDILANVDYFCIAASLPDVSVTEVQSSYRNQYGYTPGERIEYSPLIVTFLVDEDMINYKELYNWMLDNSKGVGDATVDATLAMLSSHSNVIQEVKFKDCFPTNLTALEFNAQNTEVEYFTAQATLRYNYYEFL